MPHLNVKALLFQELLAHVLRGLARVQTIKAGRHDELDDLLMAVAAAGP